MAEAEPWRPLPFDEVIDISAGEARKRRLRRQLHAWYAFVITLVIANQYRRIPLRAAVAGLVAHGADGRCGRAAC